MANVMANSGANDIANYRGKLYGDVISSFLLILKVFVGKYRASKNTKRCFVT
jgi:hypothetical protein